MLHPAKRRTPDTSNLAIVYRDIHQLHPDSKNPRIHSDKQIHQIARSIEAFGFNVPFLVDQELRLIAGHGRLAACQFLGIKAVPTICLDHLTENQIKAFIIADNRPAEQAAWDPKLLADQLSELCQVELDFDLEATGFEVGEIDVLLEDAVPGKKGVPTLRTTCQKLARSELRTKQTCG